MTTVQFDRADVSGVQMRYAHVRAALDQLQAAVAAQRPDVLLLIGDDQHENYNEENLPQFAIYTGEEVNTAGRWADGRTYPCHTQLAGALLESCVEQARARDLAGDRQQIVQDAVELELGTQRRAGIDQPPESRFVERVER